jgi:hypothetical protein
MLPDDYLRKMKQDLAEVEVQVEIEVEAQDGAKTRYEPVSDGQRTARCGDGLPTTGGFASLQPEDADHAVEVCRQQDPMVRCRVQLRLEPENHVTAKRAPAAD